MDVRKAIIGYNKPPIFDGSNYGHWKSMMKIFMMGQDMDAWFVTQNGINVNKDETKWTEDEKKIVGHNSRAMCMLYSGVCVAEYNRISSCEIANEIWKKLEVVFKGTSKVKASRISLLVREYELFCMKSSKTITEMFCRFSDIVNELKLLGKVYENSELVKKVLGCLSETWDAKKTAIEEAHDLDKLFLDELLRSLKPHELNLKRREIEKEEAKAQ